MLFPCEHHWSKLNRLFGLSSRFFQGMHELCITLFFSPFDTFWHIFANLPVTLSHTFLSWVVLLWRWKVAVAKCIFIGGRYRPPLFWTPPMLLLHKCYTLNTHKNVQEVVLCLVPNFQQIKTTKHSNNATTDNNPITR